MHSTVYVIDDLDHTRYAEDAIFSGLPAGCDYITEVPLSEIREDDIRGMLGNMEPVIVRNGDQFDVQLKTEKVREYLTDIARCVRSQMHVFESALTDKTGVYAGFFRAAENLRDLYGFRIMDGYQDDLHAWLIDKLTKADREKEDTISFSIVQAFDFYY